ncbi:alpha/beta fold hydrolase [Vibrio tapetis]|uniref:HTH luxR-type domain-containing protein n=1 Tax=Vibrio tapetis subsp. tapetis TaxID=1671868 RepID=A0A2N8ZMF7_9VIBR|nr:alpha/beta fold hydrolase [Vibrio tapetis]SON53108.1 protein of unknown function [Vibrio tapetis subsp. tapetis]
MHSSQLPDRLVGKIYDTALEPRLWPELLEHMVTYLKPNIEVGEQGKINTNLIWVKEPKEEVPSSYTQLLEHMQRSSDIAKRLGVVKEKECIQRKLLNQIPLPCVLLRADKQIVEINDSAMRYMSTNRELSVNGSHLTFESGRLRAEFESGMASLFFPGQKNKEIAFVVRPSFDTNPTTINLTRVDNLQGLESHVLMFIATVDQAQKVDVSSFSTRFKLTQAEQEILKSLVEGKTLQLVAAHKKVSIHTVRSQLKSIFGKTGCHRQSELVKLVLLQSTQQERQQKEKQNIILLDAQCFHQTMLLPDGRKLGYSDVGNKSHAPLVMLHPSTGSRLQQHPNKQIAFEQRVRVISIDRPGYGLSDTCEGASLKSVAKDVGYLMDSLNIQRFAVAGFCGGGPYALAVAAQFRHRVVHTNLISSVTPFQEINLLHGVKTTNKMMAHLALKAPEVLRHLIFLIAKNVVDEPERYFDQVIEHLGVSDASVLQEPEALENFVVAFQEAMRQGSAAFVHDLYTLSNPWETDYSAITSPITMWHGHEDRHVPIQYAQQLAHVLSNVTIKNQPQHGHFLIYYLWGDILAESAAAFEQDEQIESA